MSALPCKFACKALAGSSAYDLSASSVPFQFAFLSDSLQPKHKVQIPGIEENRVVQSTRNSDEAKLHRFMSLYLQQSHVRKCSSDEERDCCIHVGGKAAAEDSIRRGTDG